MCAGSVNFAGTSLGAPSDGAHPSSASLTPQFGNWINCCIHLERSDRPPLPHRVLNNPSAPHSVATPLRDHPHRVYLAARMSAVIAPTMHANGASNRPRSITPPQSLSPHLAPLLCSPRPDLGGQVHLLRVPHTTDGPQRCRPSPRPRRRPRRQVSIPNLSYFLSSTRHSNPLLLYQPSGLSVVPVSGLALSSVASWLVCSAMSLRRRFPAPS